MKIAVLADIHGNLAALQAVLNDIEQWQPVRTIVAGDIVNGGPDNVACWSALEEKQSKRGWLLLRGNHEEYVAEWLTGERPSSPALFELQRPSYHTFLQMGALAPALAALPDRFGWQAPDGSSLLTLHASIWGSRTGIYPWTPAGEMRKRLAPYPAVFATAHTHVPFVRQVDDTLLINVGAVGLPGDGDSRASYGRLTWTQKEGWRAALRRVPYDHGHAEAAFAGADFLAAAGPIALLTLVELRIARDVKTSWAQGYRRLILQGELSVAASVRSFLTEEKLAQHLPSHHRIAEQATDG